MKELLSLIIFLFSISSLGEDKKMSNSDIYYAQIEAKNVKVKAYVNDIEILSKGEASFNVDMPVNYYLVDGKNTFHCDILPIKSLKTFTPDSSCKMKLHIRKITGPNGKLENLDKNAPGLSEVAVIAAKENSNQKIQSANQTFTIKLPFPNPPWATGLKVPNTEAVHKQIFAKYKEYYELIKKKDLEGLMKLNSIKYKLMASSIYQQEKKFQDSLKESLDEKWETGSGWKLVDFEKQEPRLTYHYSFDDRLIEIRNGDDRSPIQFYHADEGVTEQYPLIYYFNGKDFDLAI